jgi:hypothetical protein
MTRYALIKGGVIATVVEQETLPTVDMGGQWVACGSAGPGWTYNGSTFAPPTVFLSLPLRDFWRRFTAAEREALVDMLANGTAVQKKKLGAFRDYLHAGGNVELADDYVIASVTLMESAGVIGVGRAAQVLAT